jgi:hypothetical protein
MNELDAAYHTVHDYPGGAEALGVRLNKRGTTLSNELRPPPGSTAKFGLLDAVKVMELTRDLRMLDAINARFGRMSIPLPALDVDTGEAVFTAVTKVTQEFGEYLAQVSEALADGKVTEREVRGTQRELGELIQRAQQLQAQLLRMHEDGKPPFVRLETKQGPSDAARR